MHVFLIHGAYGNPDENWLPWLKVELEKQGHIVHVPAFPTPDGQTLERWRAAFEPYARFLSKDSVLVGHSIGCAFILDVLEKRRAHAALLVSGFASLLGNKFDKLNRTFVDRKFDWGAITQNCPSFTLFHGSDDPYVPVQRARELATQLRAPLRIVQNGAHLNESAGFATFPALLSEFRALRER